MKKTSLTKRILCMILAAVTVFSMGACKKKKGPDPVAADESASLVFEGVHDYTAPDTEYDFIVNGTTDYAVVIPANASSELRNAKDEFVYLLGKAVDGLNIRVLSDEGLTYDPEQKYISLGETTLLATSGLTIDKEAIGFDGLRIVTKGRSVFICGGADSGTCYGVYTFMQIYFDFETFWADTIEIDACFNAKLKAFDVTDIPDIDYRCYAGQYYYDYSLSSLPDEKNFARRLRFEHMDDDYMLPIYKHWVKNPAEARVFHNWSAYIPRYSEGDEGRDHPKWYSDIGGGTESTDQACFTAHGDPEEFEAMAQLCARKAENTFMLFPPDEYPYGKIVTLTIGDNANHCNCDACTAVKERAGGSDAGAMIIFVNHVAELVDAWMKDEANAAYRRDDFRILFFAYNGGEQAPARWDEAQGKYVVTSPEFELGEHVGVYCAPINKLDVQSDIFAEVNDEGRKNLRAWGDIADEIYYWTYSTNYTYYMYPFDSVSFYANGFKYLAAYGNAKFIFNQSQANQHGTATAFHNYKTWLDSKLEWDVNADIAALTDRYFAAMYGPAAEIMKGLYDEMRLKVMQYNSETGWYRTRNVYSKIGSERKYWPAATLISWLKKFETMYALIEPYKTSDPDRYDALYLHITQEFLCPSYIMIYHQSTALTDSERAALVDAFKNAVALTGITNIAEHALMDGYVNGL